MWNTSSPDRLEGQLHYLDVFRDVKSCDGSDDVPEVLVTLDDDNEAKFEDAKQQELHSWKSYGVYPEVPKIQQKLSTTRWMRTMRELPDKSYKPRARLVVRGFEEREMESSEKLHSSYFNIISAIAEILKILLKTEMDNTA